MPPPVCLQVRLCSQSRAVWVCTQIGFGDYSDSGRILAGPDEISGLRRPGPGANPRAVTRPLYVFQMSLGSFRRANLHFCHQSLERAVNHRQLLVIKLPQYVWQHAARGFWGACNDFFSRAGDLKAHHATVAVLAHAAYESGAAELFDEVADGRLMQGHLLRQLGYPQPGLFMQLSQRPELRPADAGHALNRGEMQLCRAKYFPELGEHADCQFVVYSRRFGGLPTLSF